MERTVIFRKGGVEFGSSMLNLAGWITLTGERHEDFPDPFPHRVLLARLIDDDGSTVIAITEWNTLRHLLHGGDLSKINAAADREEVELEWGSR